MPHRPQDIMPPLTERSRNRLPVQVAFTVPSTREGEIPIRDRAFKRRIKEIREQFTQWFGGDTSVRGRGGYWDGSQLISEDVAVVESFTTSERYREHREDLGNLVKEKQRNWGQDQIAFEVEGDLYLYPERDFVDDQPI